jgi:hypothetical protein
MDRKESKALKTAKKKNTKYVWPLLCYKPGDAGSIPKEFIGFFSLPKAYSCSMALGSTQPLTEMSTRNLLACNGLQARKAENLTAISEPIV